MEKKQITDIQQLVNKRADEKLEKNLRAIHDVLYGGEGYQLLKDIKINVGTHEKPKVIGLAFILSSDGFRKQIIENNTDRYREAEAKEFLAKVESIRDDVDYLLDNSNR